MAGLGSFIFDSSKGETPQSIAMKRAIAQQIMGRGGQRSARNTGEGIGNALASIGDGIVANVMNRRANKGETEGQASANSLYNSIVGGITGGIPMTQAAGELADTNPSANPSTVSYSGLPASGDPLNYRDAIASIESAGSGDYSAIGPTNKKLGRALGRYQIMEANIGPWSKEVLGREVTPDEFMANPQLQDAIFDGKFGSYVNQYGPSGAAQAWFAGEGGVGKLDRKDVLGTSVGDYTNKFVNAIGGQNGAAISPQAAIDAIASPSGAVNPPSQVIEPQFDMGRFGDRMNLAEMPPSPDQLQGSLLEQQNAYVQASPMEEPVDVPTMPAAQYQQQPQQQFAPVEVAQAGNGYFPPAPQPSSMPSTAQQQQRLQQLMQAAGNPFLNEGQRSVINTMLQQELQNMDPYRQAQIRKMNNEFNSPNLINAGGGNLYNPTTGEWIRPPVDPNAPPSELGLNPQYGVDETGNPVLLQLSKEGKVVRSQLPEGVQLSKEPIRLDAGTHYVLLDPITRQPVGQVDKNLSGAEAQKELGKSQGEFLSSLPTEIANSEKTVAELDALIGHSGLSEIVGPIDQYRPSFTMSNEGRDALARFNQVRGNAFLQAYGMLKGGGQITEVEGLKAEQAMARMDRAQSEKEFRTAMKDFRDAVSSGMNKMRERAGIKAKPNQAVRQPVTIGGYTIEQVD